MENLKAGGMEISALLHNVTKPSSSVGIGDNYTDKSLEKKVSPCVDPVVQAAVGEAKERLKKLEQDYQRTFKKYREVQLNRYRCHMDGKGLKHHSYWTGYCIRCCKNQVKELQNVLDRVNIEEVSQRGIETPNHSKKFLMLHGCRNLAQEKMILQQKAEHIQPNSEKLSKTEIDFRAANFNREFRGILEEVPKICSKKHVHDLLSELKEANRLRKEATEGGAIKGNNNRSQDNIQTCTSSVIKILVKLIRELEKEKSKKDNILLEKGMVKQGYSDKMRHLEEKKEWICGKWDDERKYMLRLKNIDDGLQYFLPDSERWSIQQFLYFE